MSIESCSYEIPTNLQEKVDTIDELISLYVDVNDADMSESILQVLEKDLR